MAIRTYGFDLDDWQMDTFTVEVRFEREPAEAELEAMGYRWAAFRSSVAEIGGWQFSGPFAVLSYEPYDGRERITLGEGLLHLLEALRPPVNAAIYVETEDDLPNDLEPGPAYPGARRPADAALPPLATAPAFERGVTQYTEEESAAELATFLDAAAKQPVGLAPSEATRALPPPAWLEKKAGRIIDRLPGAPIYLCYELELGDSFAPPRESAFVAPRAERALYLAAEEPKRSGINRGTTLVLLEADGNVRPVWRSSDFDQGLEGVAWLGDDRAVVTTTKRIVLLDLAKGEVLAERGGAGGSVLVSAGGRLLAVWTNQGVRLVALIGEQLSELARFDSRNLGLGGAVGGEVRLRLTEYRVGYPVGERWFRLTGVDDALAEVAEKHRAKKKKRPRKKKPKPTLEPIPWDALAPDTVLPSLPEADKAAFAAAGIEITLVDGAGTPQATRVGELAVATSAEGFALRHADEPAKVLRCDRPQHPRPAPDGSRLFGLAATVVSEGAPGEEAMSPIIDWLRIKGLGHFKDLAAVSPDEIAVLLSKGLQLLRRTDAGWEQHARRKIPAVTHMLVDPVRREAWLGATGRQRLWLVSLDDGKALAKFEEDANDLRLGDAGWQVADHRRQLAWRVVIPG